MSLCTLCVFAFPCTFVCFCYFDGRMRARVTTAARCVSLSRISSASSIGLLHLLSLSSLQLNLNVLFSFISFYGTVAVFCRILQASLLLGVAGATSLVMFSHFTVGTHELPYLNNMAAWYSCGCVRFAAYQYPLRACPFCRHACACARLHTRCDVGMPHCFAFILNREFIFILISTSP